MSASAPEMLSQFTYAPALKRQLESLIDGNMLGNACLLYGDVASPLEKLACTLAQSFCALHPIKGNKNPRPMSLQGNPDIRIVKPLGSQGYVNEQIQSIIEEAMKAPLYSQKKFFIITDAHRLGVSCANAFLKTLEEPTPSTCFILFTHEKSALLDTIISRCLQIYVPPQPLEAQVRALSQEAQVEELRALLALASQRNDKSRALRFLGDSIEQEIQSSLLSFLEAIDAMPDYRILQLGLELTELVGREDEQLKQAHKQEMVEQKDFLTSSLSKKLEQQYKRALSMRTKERLASLAFYVEALASFMSYVQGLEKAQDIQSSLGKDRASKPEGVAGITKLQELAKQFEGLATVESSLIEKFTQHSCGMWIYLQASRALREVLLSKAKTMSFSQISTLVQASRVLENAIAYNTSIESCIDDMLYNIREAFISCNE